MPETRPGEHPERDWNPEAVRDLRTRLTLTQAEFAERLGTRQQTVSEWETGARAPRRMSRRLLGLVAEESGVYDASPPAGSLPVAPPSEATSSEAPKGMS